MCRVYTCKICFGTSKCLFFQNFQGVSTTRNLHGSTMDRGLDLLKSRAGFDSRNGSTFWSFFGSFVRKRKLEKCAISSLLSLAARTNRRKRDPTSVQFPTRGVLSTRILACGPNCTFHSSWHTRHAPQKLDFLDTFVAVFFVDFFEKKKKCLEEI